MKKLIYKMFLILVVFSLFIASFNAKDLINVVEKQKSDMCKVTINNDDKYINFVIEKDNERLDYLYFVGYKITKLSDEFSLKNITVKLEESSDNKTFETVAENVKIKKLNDDTSIAEFNKLKAKKVYFRFSIYNNGNLLNPSIPGIYGELNVKTELVKQHNYKEGVQLFTAELSGYYRVELWGAKGNYFNQGNIDKNATKPSELSGNGAYTAGTIYLDSGTKLYVFTGENQIQSGNYVSSTFNGGAAGKEGAADSIHYGGAGGGATDIRYFSDAESESLSNSIDELLDKDTSILSKEEYSAYKANLFEFNRNTIDSRIMVAGAGAGAMYAIRNTTGLNVMNYNVESPEYRATCSGRGGDAGGLVGYDGSNEGINLYQADPSKMSTEEIIVNNPKGGNQTSAGAGADCAPIDDFCNFLKKYNQTETISKLFGEGMNGSKPSKGIYPPSKGIGGSPYGGSGYYGGSGGAYIYLMTPKTDEFLRSSEIYDIVALLKDETVGEATKEFFVNYFMKKATCKEVLSTDVCEDIDKKAELENIVSIISTIDNESVSDEAIKAKSQFRTMFNNHLERNRRYRLFQSHTSGAGGSSYISGHTGCVAVDENGAPKSGCDTGTNNNSCSIHTSDLVFTDTLMIDGRGYKWTNKNTNTHEAMPKPSSVYDYYDKGVGHLGSGAARITLLELEDEDSAIAESSWVKTFEEEKNTIINPPTSDFKVFIYVIISFLTIFFAVYYYKKVKLNSK